MTFVPYPDKIEIEPIKKEGIISDPNNNYLEMGTVLAVGKDVQFVEVGDTVFFPSYGVLETPEVDGVKHYVIPDSSEFVLGKYVAEK